MFVTVKEYFNVFYICIRDMTGKPGRETWDDMQQARIKLCSLSVPVIQMDLSSQINSLILVN